MWDEERPKRATTAYLVFLERHRKRVTEANPDTKPKEITTLLAIEWRKVSDDEKQECEAIAARDKDRHAKEMAEYNTGNKKKTRKKKDPDRPKRATTAYMVFCNRHRKSVTEANPELKPKDVTARLAELWKKVTDAEKQECEKLAADDKERHETEMAAYNKRKEEEKAAGAPA